jgi:hypothetical protein
MITELNKRSDTEWAARAIEKNATFTAAHVNTDKQLHKSCEMAIVGTTRFTKGTIADIPTRLPIPVLTTRDVAYLLLWVQRRGN